MAINPSEPTLAEEQSGAFSEFGGGKQFIARGFDITALPIEDIIGKKGLKQLEKAGVDTTGSIRLDELRAFLDEHGLAGKQLDRDFRKALTEEELFFKGGRLASQSLLEKTTLDVTGGEAVAGVQQDAMDLLTGGVDLLQQGMALAGGKIDDPLAQDILRSFNNQFGMAQAARGMGTQFSSGQAPFQSVTGGLSALSQFGLGLMGAGGAGMQAAFQLNPFLNPGFTLDRLDLGFQRDLFDFTFQKMLEQQHRAQKFLSEQSTIQNIIGGASILKLSGGAQGSNVSGGGGSGQGNGGQRSGFFPSDINVQNFP